MGTSEKERISEDSWDGSAGRFTDEQYESSCVLDRKVCGGEWADKPPKTRCSLPIKEPGGELSRAGVHAAAARIGQVKDACAEAIASAKAKLRSAYKTLGEDPPDSLSSSKSEEATTVYRDRALASLDHEWELREKAENGFLGTLAGHFAVFNRWTEIDSPLEGHFMERVAPGAFAKTFAENRKNMRVLLNHGRDPSVGMKPLGPIRSLEEDSTGAAYEVGLLDTSYNRDLVPGLKEGLFGSSFRFQIRREDFEQFPQRSDDNPQGIPQSTIREAKVKEFGPVTFGQYEAATAGLRSLNDDLVGLELALMARSDPGAVATFARAISQQQELHESGFSQSRVMVPFQNQSTSNPTQATFTVAGANVGTKPDGERNDPTNVDGSILWALQDLKAHVAQVQGMQLTDPDDDDDDDDAVTSALSDIQDAVDAAIKAQAADCRPEPDDDDDDDSNGNGPSDMMYSESESEDDKSREDETETSPVVPAVPSALADRAPVRGPTPPGATLKKRAALLTHHTDKEPSWKL